MAPYFISYPWLVKHQNMQTVEKSQASIPQPTPIRGLEARVGRDKFETTASPACGHSDCWIFLQKYRHK